MIPDSQDCLPEAFYDRPCVEVARDLIGTMLTVIADRQIVSGRIVEVEAYLGSEDAASHAARGPTGRSGIMFGPPAVAYVYLIYGMHHCLNFVTESQGTAGAVLIRALEPVSGIGLMARRRGDPVPSQLTNGPGKLCQACGIGISWNGMRLTMNKKSGNRLWVAAGRAGAVRIGAGRRIGIRKAQEFPYRFVDLDSEYLSAPI